MRKHTFRWLVAGLIALAALNLALLVAAPGQRSTVVLDDISECLTPFAAAAACLRAAARHRGRTRQAWGLIGLSALSWGLGQAAWTYQEVILGLHPADLFPSYPDLGFLTAVPLAIVGLLRLPGAAAKGGTGVRSLFDGMIIAGGVLFISWDLVLGPVYAASPTDVFQTVVGLAYPASDVAMVTIVLLTIGRLQSGQRSARLLLASGLMLNAVADSFFAYLTTVQDFGASNPIDIGWTLGFGLIALAGTRAIATSSMDTTRQPRWTLWMPYGAAAIAGVLAIVTEVTVGSLNRVLESDLLFIITAVLARQFLFLRETSALNGQIARQNDELNWKVRERTRALSESLEDLYRTDFERRILLQRMVTLQEEERQQIAEVIHDDMLQSMVGAKMRMFLLRGGSDADVQTATTVEAAIDRAIRRMRSLMNDLRPQIIEMGLVPILEQSVAEFNEDGRIAVTLQQQLVAEPAPLVATTLYRIAREAVNNAQKHAPGATVTVIVRGSAEVGFTAVISDDGPGFTPREDGGSPQGHLGLTSMRERAEAMGGWLRLTTAPGQGTTIQVWLPQRLELLPDVPEVPAA